MTLINNNKSGFALLITIIMLGVIISVTLSMVRLSLQQLKLAVDGRDAEIAFQAASAGVECVRRIMTIASSTIQAGEPINQQCFEGEPIQVSRLDLSDIGFRVPTNAQNFVHRYHFDGGVQWGDLPRCMTFELIVVNAEDREITIGGNPRQQRLTNVIASYPSNSLLCPEGAVCHIAAVTGFSTRCGSREQSNTLRREILIEL